MEGDESRRAAPQAHASDQGRLETRPDHSFPSLLIRHPPRIGYRSDSVIASVNFEWTTVGYASRALTLHYKTTCDNAFYLLCTLLQRQLHNWSKSECIPIPSTA
ncbi:hypothetical protein E2C01_088831 [Portunus trituberculatus]|uniref:Uncharacterized protein n=1 Tax=Portunus trituberculatus TaxID=210409 RepID=A0A5B7J775_PORTR|nr:hypothetical protein [Portunus trituberculatus]